MMPEKMRLFSQRRHDTIAKQTKIAMKTSEPESKAKPSPASADKQSVTVFEKLLEQSKTKNATSATETKANEENMLLIPQKNAMQKAEKQTVSSLVKRL